MSKFLELVDMLRQSPHQATIGDIENICDAIDTLTIHANNDVLEGWVCIPRVEWDAVINANACSRGA